MDDLLPRLSDCDTQVPGNLRVRTSASGGEFLRCAMHDRRVMNFGSFSNKQDGLHYACARGLGRRVAGSIISFKT